MQRATLSTRSPPRPSTSSNLLIPSQLISPLAPPPAFSAAAAAAAFPAKGYRLHTNTRAALLRRSHSPTALSGGSLRPAALQSASKYPLILPLAPGRSYRKAVRAHMDSNAAAADMAGGDGAAAVRLPVGGAAAAPPPQVVLPEGVTETTVTFLNELGQKLVGTYVDAGGAAGTTSSPPPCAILCHGYVSSRASALLVATAAELAGRGISSLRFDFSGNGDSEGTFAFANYEREVGDVRAAVAFVRDALGKRVLAVLGHSKGGNIVLLHASRYNDVPLTVNVAGRYDMRRGLLERFGSETIEKVFSEGQVEHTAMGNRFKVTFMLTKKDLEERMGLDMEAAARRIEGRVLTIHGTDDRVIPVEDGQAFSRIIPNHTLQLVEGADHNFRAAAASRQAVLAAADFIAAAAGASA